MSTINGSIGKSAAGRRIFEAGLAYQRRLAQQEEASRLGARPRKLEGEELIIRVQRALNRFSGRPDLAPVTDDKSNTVDRVASIYSDAFVLFGKKRSEINSVHRDKDLVTVRFYVAQRFNDELHLSKPHIGRIIGGRDHTTVMNALKPKNRDRVRVAVEAVKAEHAAMLEMRWNAQPSL